MDPFAISQLRVPLNHHEITDLNNDLNNIQQAPPIQEEEKQLIRHALKFYRTLSKTKEEGKPIDEFRAEAETIVTQLTNFLQRRGIDFYLLARGLRTPKDEIPDGALKTTIEDADQFLDVLDQLVVERPQ